MDGVPVIGEGEDGGVEGMPAVVGTDDAEGVLGAAAGGGAGLVEGTKEGKVGLREAAGVEGMEGDPIGGADGVGGGVIGFSGECGEGGITSPQVGEGGENGGGVGGAGRGFGGGDGGVRGEFRAVLTEDHSGKVGPDGGEGANISIGGEGGVVSEAEPSHVKGEGRLGKGSGASGGGGVKVKDTGEGGGDKGLVSGGNGSSGDGRRHGPEAVNRHGGHTEAEDEELALEGGGVTVSVGQALEGG